MNLVFLFSPVIFTVMKWRRI